MVQFLLLVMGPFAKQALLFLSSQGAAVVRILMKLTSRDVNRNLNWCAILWVLYCNMLILACWWWQCLVTLICCHCYFAIKSFHCANSVTYLFDFIIESALLCQVTQLILISLSGKISTLILAHSLPYLAHFLHYTKCPEIGIRLNNFGSCLFHKNHIRR